MLFFLSSVPPVLSLPVRATSCKTYLSDHRSQEAVDVTFATESLAFENSRKENDISTDKAC